MSHISSPERTAIDRSRDYVDWAAILGGAIVAAAISIIMTTFGAALGLSLTSPLPGEGVSGPIAALTTALWALWIGVSSFAAGGYLAGRLRRRVQDATEEESNVRDGAHGAIVWALGTVMLAVLAASTIGAATRTAATAAGSATGGVLATIADKANVADPFNLAVDRLVRGRDGNVAGQDRTTINREEVAHILTQSVATGAISQDDKNYLASQIAASTGLSPPEAEKRIDDAAAQLKSAVETARQAADKARRYGIVIAFLTAASLLVSGAAAWAAAVVGGNHRDSETIIFPLSSRIIRDRD